MKKTTVLFFLAITSLASAQTETQVTDQIVVTGKVKNQINFSLNELEVFTPKSIDSIVIYSHLMEPRKTIRNIKGVLLKDVIDKAGIDAGSAKLLSEFYITCIASDNYKVVFSWNEIYNSPNGENILIITEADGKKAGALPDRIATISANDRATGRRYVKGLQKIVVEQAK